MKNEALRFGCGPLRFEPRPFASFMLLLSNWSEGCGSAVAVVAVVEAVGIS